MLYSLSHVFTGFLGPQGPFSPSTHGLLTSTIFVDVQEVIKFITTKYNIYLQNFIEINKS